MKPNTFPVGFLTNGNASDDAIILEARWLLASRYKWEGRCMEADRTLNNNGRFSISHLLDIWDLYNKDAENRSRRDYYIMTRLELDSWGSEPTSETE
jgi:hypothetical protein